LTSQERAGFLLVLEWFENFRLRHELAAGREATRAFWRTEVLREGRPLSAGGLAVGAVGGGAALVAWYLKWLEGCAEAKADHRSLPERVRAAVQAAGSRRGLATTTKRCYGAWAARYAAFAGGEREAMEVETASRFLASVVHDEDCAYSTQKQALYAVAFFFKQVCRVVDPVFNVKLRKTGTRVPVVLSKTMSTERLVVVPSHVFVRRIDFIRGGVAARPRCGLEAGRPCLSRRLRAHLRAPISIVPRSTGDWAALARLLPLRHGRDIDVEACGRSLDPS
jgi:hypothetical protein